MPSAEQQLFDLVEKSIRFEYDSGATTHVTYPHTTGWRTLPVVVTAQVGYSGLLELKDGAKIRILPGETFIVPPGRLHCVSRTSPRGNNISRWSHLQCEVLPGVSLFTLLEPPAIFRRSRSRRIGQINHEMGRLAESGHSMGALLRRQALGWELITLLLRAVRFNPQRVELLRQASRLTPVLAFIEKHLVEPITHAGLARQAGLSTSRFHFLFRAALGVAPYEYVRGLRLRKAQQLLIRTDRLVAEIGCDVGHPDPYHFSRMFRRSVGMSPTEYRQRTPPPSF